MKKSHDHPQPDKYPYDIPPSEQEVQQTKRLMEDAYDLRLPKPTAVRLASLAKALARLGKSTTKAAVDDIVKNLKEILAQSRTEEITESQALAEAKAVLELVVVEEKHNIAGEMREIIITHRPIPDDPAVTKKITELIRLKYQASIPEPELEQVIQYLWRILWEEEGLDSSLEACLDDFLLEAKGRKRGHEATSHPGVREALDWTVEKLTGKDTETSSR